MKKKIFFLKFLFLFLLLFLIHFKCSKSVKKWVKIDKKELKIGFFIFEQKGKIA